MRAAAVLFLLLSAVSQALSAQAATRALKVTEKAVPGQAAGVCPDDQPVCYADIESTLSINPDISFLGSSDSAEALAVDDSALAARRQALLDALEALRASLELSRQIIEAVGEGSEAKLAEAQGLSPKFEAQQRALFRALDQYVKASAAELGLPADPSQGEIDDVLDDALPMSRGKMDDWIANELRRVDQQSEARVEALKARSELLVRLGAFRSRPGTEPLALNLPGYDEIPPGELKPFRRISFEITEEQRQQLAEEMKFNAEVIAKIAALRAEAAASGGALEALASEAKALAESLQENLDGVLEDLQADLEEIASSLTKLRAAVDGLQTSVKDLKADLESLATALDVDAVDVAADRPDLLLLNLLGKLRPLQKGGPLKEVLAQAGKVRESVESVKKQIAAAPAELQADLRETLQKALAATAEDAGPLAQLALKLTIPGAGRMEETARNLGAILATKMGDPRRFTITGDKVVPTDLEILRSDPKAGDTIELVLEVRRAPASGVAGEQGRLVHEERKSIRVDVYGWSSGVASGIGMIKARKTDLANFEPSAIAVWRLGFQPRPGSGTNLYRLRPGFGIHVSTLDFSEGDSVEMGAGVALHLFKDLLQVGYGWNLNVEDDRQYWYLGIGLFDLLRGD